MLPDFCQTCKFDPLWPKATIHKVSWPSESLKWISNQFKPENRVIWQYWDYGDQKSEFSWIWGNFLTNYQYRSLQYIDLWHLHTFWRIRKTSTTLWSRVMTFAKFQLFCEEKQFFSIFSKNMRLNPYVASQLVYKHGHCAHFAVSEKSLRPSGTKFVFFYCTTRWTTSKWVLDST